MDEPSMMIPTMDERAAAAAAAAATVIQSSVGVGEDEEREVLQNNTNVDCVTDKVEEEKIREYGFEIIEDVDTIVERHDDENTPIPSNSWMDDADADRERETAQALGIDAASPASSRESNLIIHYYDRTHTNVKDCIDGEDCDPLRITNEKKEKMTNITKETHKQGGVMVPTTTSSSTEPKPKMMRIHYYDTDNLVAPVHTGIIARAEDAGGEVDTRIDDSNNHNKSDKIGNNEEKDTTTTTTSIIIHHHIHGENETHTDNTDIEGRNITTNRNDNTKTHGTERRWTESVSVVKSTTPGIHPIPSSLKINAVVAAGDSNTNPPCVRNTVTIPSPNATTEDTANTPGRTMCGMEATSSSVQTFNSYCDDTCKNDGPFCSSVVGGTNCLNHLYEKTIDYEDEYSGTQYNEREVIALGSSSAGDATTNSMAEFNNSKTSSMVSDRIAYYNRLGNLNGVDSNDDEVAVMRSTSTDNLRNRKEKLRSRTKIDIAGGNKRNKDDEYVDGRDAVIANVSDDEVEIEVDDIFEARTSASEDDHNEHIGKERVNKEDIDSTSLETKLHTAVDDNDDIVIMNKTTNNLAVSYLRTAKTTSHLVMADINKAIPYEDFVGLHKSGLQFTE